MREEIVVVKFFPFTKKGIKAHSNRAILGIGANIGDILKTFRHLFLKLRSHPHIELKESSPIYINPPFGIENQPYFYNAVLHIETSYSYNQLFSYIMYLEKRFKRVRVLKNGPRTLDIDMIFFNNLTLKSKKLTLPHPKWSERKSVKIPLSFLGEYRCLL
ncbi:MAG: 2-amino-4-hydroxy-6-hydroxymethyldihydropteridine diphosphokinase [Campylobacterales bacterium]